MHFDQAQAMFRNDQIRELAEHAEGIRYLKLRSLNRRENLEALFRSAGITPSEDSADAMFREAYGSPAVDASLIEAVIRSIYEGERMERREREAELVNQLYRLQVFDWGGLRQNMLERTIVDNYVKKITDYDTLSDKIENELHNSMRGYVLCSWYNHWTSIIIEDVFRDHPALLPAVGRVKKIDFFLNDVPFDLKTTYLPEGYIKAKRREDGLRPELTLLRQGARSRAIAFDADLPDGKLLEDLWAKHRDHSASVSQQLISELGDYRRSLLGRCQKEPGDLLRWLYENQGERRFDAANRLILVLVDQSNFFDSWKLKRAKPLLDDRITAYLDAAGANPGRTVEFDWRGSTYTALADIIFIVHPGSVS